LTVNYSIWSIRVCVCVCARIKSLGATVKQEVAQRPGTKDVFTLFSCYTAASEVISLPFLAS